MNPLPVVGSLRKLHTNPIILMNKMHSPLVWWFPRKANYTDNFHVKLVSSSQPENNVSYKRSGLLSDNYGFQSMALS